MLRRLSRRDRIALAAGGVATLVILLVRFAVFPLLDYLGESGNRLERNEAVLQHDQRLIAEVVPAQARLAQAQRQLKDLETGLLGASSESLASAEWQQLIRQLADSKGIEIASSEVVRIEDLGGQYGLVVGRTQFRCRTDQLVDLLAAMATSPKLLSVRRISITSREGDPQQRLDVALTMGAALRMARRPGNTATQPARQ